MQTNVKSPYHIQFDTFTVCANNDIFALVVLSFFCGRVGFGGPQHGLKSAKTAEGVQRKSLGTTAIVGILHQ